MKYYTLIFLLVCGVFADQRKTLSCKYVYFNGKGKVSNKIHIKTNENNNVVWVDGGFIEANNDVEYSTMSTPRDTTILVHHPEHETLNEFTVFGIVWSISTEQVIGEDEKVKFPEGILSCKMTNGWE